jgi:hypothetical protein
MKSFICYTILLLFISNASYCNSPKDSLTIQLKQLEKNYAQKQDSINKVHINRLDSTFKRREDSLRKEILIYKLKDSFYSDKYAGLATIFSTVMAIIATVITGLGVAFVIERINKTKSELEAKLADTIAKTKDLENNLTASYLNFILYQAKISAEKTIDLLQKKEMVSAIEEAISGIKHYCKAFSLSQDLSEPRIDGNVMQQRIDSEVKSLINRAKSSCTNLRTRVNNNEKLITTNWKSYSSRLKEINNDVDLDDLIAKNTSASVRESFYYFKSELSLLLVELKSKKIKNKK